MLLLCGAVSFNLLSASSIEIYYIITERELQKKNCTVPLGVGCVLISSHTPKMLIPFLTNRGPLATMNSQDALTSNIGVACTASKRGPAKLPAV